MSISFPPPKNFWKEYSSYITTPVAAGLAIVIPFRDLMQKSHLQLQQKEAKVMWTTGIKEGIKNVPLLSGIVGSQLAMEKWLSGDHPTIKEKLKNSAIVGFAFSIPLAIFNGKTMKLSIKQSLQRLSIPLCLLIAARDTAFVGGAALASPMSDTLKKQLGDYTVITIGSAFVSGAFGAIAGHPFDTILTRSQKGMATKVAEYSLGALTRTRGVGLFVALYTMNQKLFS